MRPKFFFVSLSQFQRGMTPPPHFKTLGGDSFGKKILFGVLAQTCGPQYLLQPPKNYLAEVKAPLKFDNDQLPRLTSRHFLRGTRTTTPKPLRICYARTLHVHFTAQRIISFTGLFQLSWFLISRAHFNKNYSPLKLTNLGFLHCCRFLAILHQLFCKLHKLGAS